MPYVKAGKIKYYIEQSFSGKKDQSPHIVLLHGFTGSVEDWSEIRFGLEEHYDMTFIDLPGHGKTEVPEKFAENRMEKQAANLNQLISQLSIDEFVLYGYSMGGRLALYYALNYPEKVKKLILESASPGIKNESERTERRKTDERLAKVILNEGIEKFVDTWMELPFFQSLKNLPADKYHKLVERKKNSSPEGLAYTVREMSPGRAPYAGDRLRELNVPILLLSGELDKKYCGQNKIISETIKFAKNVIASGSGHNVHAEDPDFVIKNIKEFLNKTLRKNEF